MIQRYRNLEKTLKFPLNSLIKNSAMKNSFDASFEESLEKSNPCLQDVLEDASRTNSKVFLELDESNATLILSLRRALDESKHELELLALRKAQEAAVLLSEKSALISELEAMRGSHVILEAEFQASRERSAAEQESLFERIKRQQVEGQSKMEALRRSCEEDCARHVQEKALLLGEFQRLANKNLDLYAQLEKSKEEKESEIAGLRRSLEEGNKGGRKASCKEKEGERGPGLAEKIEKCVYSIDFVDYLLREFIFSGKDLNYRELIEEKLAALRRQVYDLESSAAEVAAESTGLSFPDCFSDSATPEETKTPCQPQFRMEDFLSFECIRKNLFRAFNRRDNKDYTIKILTDTWESSKEEVAFWESNKGPHPLFLPKYHGHFVEGENPRKFHLCFEHEPRNLRSLIDEHKARKQRIELDLLLWIAEKIINGLAFLQTLNVRNYELSPETIFFDETSRKIGILDIAEFEPESPGTLSRNPSSEISESFSERGCESAKFKGQALSLVLLLLELANLEAPAAEQDPKGLKRRIKEGLAELERNYEKTDEQKKARKLVGILKKAAKKDLKKRSDLVGMYYKFQRKIKNQKESLQRQIIACEGVGTNVK